MKVKLIGIGAAGNKAVIHAINDKHIDRKQCILINSTLKDMDDNYDDINFIIGDGIGGCGKERSRGKKLMIESLKNGSLEMDNAIDPDVKTVIIISSSEGGTGSGASPVLAKYIKEVLNFNVHLVVFTGFEDDARGLQNTIEYFKDLQDNFIVEAISNKKVAEVKDITDKSKTYIEDEANKIFSNKLRVYLGLDTKDSRQNIDEMDLYKINTTNGFMIIESTKPESTLKTFKDFEKSFSSLVDNTVSLAFDKSCKRMGIFLYLTEESQSIKYDFDLLKSKLGEPYEIFTHIQTVQDREDERFDLIVSGIPLPKEEVVKIYNKYKERTSKVNKSSDSFFDTLNDINTESVDEMFDVMEPELKNPSNNRKNDFFNNLDGNQPKTVTKEEKNNNRTITVGKVGDLEDTY